MTDIIRYKETQYGFDFGAASVTRLFSDTKKGWVTLQVCTQKSDIQIYVTKTGKVRIFDKGHELKKEQA